MDLLQRLQDIKTRWEEVGQLLIEPSIMNDMKRYAKLNKEYSDLNEMVEVYHKYRNLLSNIETAKRIIEGEKDEELREMAKEELDAFTVKLAPMEEEFKQMLVPAD